MPGEVGRVNMKWVSFVLELYPWLSKIIARFRSPVEMTLRATPGPWYLIHCEDKALYGGARINFRNKRNEAVTLDSFEVSLLGQGNKKLPDARLDGARKEIIIPSPLKNQLKTIGKSGSPACQMLGGQPLRIQAGDHAVGQCDWASDIPSPPPDPSMAITVRVTCMDMLRRKSRLQFQVRHLD